MKKGKLILVRHAQSTWNKEERLSGNSQIGLTPDGIEQSASAAKELLEKKIKIDVAFSSDQKRAIDTMDIVLSKMNMNIPKIESKELREGELGILNGKLISEVEKEYGKDYIFKIFREFNHKAPAKKGEPDTETLYDMITRVGKYYEANIKKHIEKGKNIIIFAHDGTLRAMLSYLGDFDENKSRITQFENAKPYIYEFGENNNE
jgi:2,3-bisphosphoglycerate-dependent phosphoglycerate mutase